jgi:GT2 family glycosyltransferase
MTTQALAAEAATAPRIRVADPLVASFERVHLGADITVGMSAYGNATTTLIALRALFNAAEGDFELILVDDCSPDQGLTRAQFLDTRREHPNTRVFSFTRNLEYSGSLNCILSHASGRHVLFLSNDIFVTPAYLREMLGVADADPRNGIVRGCANFVDNGLSTHNVQTRPIANAGDLFAAGEDIAARWAGQTLGDDFLTGDAFLVSRPVLDRIGTFDPLFYGYFADHDFGIRACSAGFRQVLARGAFAFHQQAANFSYLPEAEQQAKLSRRWSRVYENWARFKLKYQLPVEEPYTSMHAIPWQRLNTQPFDPGRHFIAPGNYLGYLEP